MVYVLRVTGPIKEQHVSASTETSTPPIEELPVEQAVQRVLDLEQVTTDVWSTSRNGRFFKAEFQVIESEKAEQILDRLTYHNVGKTDETTIMVFEPETYICKRNKTKRKKTVSQEAFQQFIRSLKCRLSVAQVYNEVRTRGTFDMNYLCFLLCAALIADLALVTNSAGVVFASMLLSPLMDPISCILFGWTLNEWNLLRKGLRNAAISLILCILLGFVFGAGAHWISYAEDIRPYPTAEMKQRGQWKSLLSATLVATISGISVAFATLSKRISALIGNAISLSLLPPAVNSGQLLLLAFMAMHGKSEEKAEEINNPNGEKCNIKWLRDYEFYYVNTQCDAPREFFFLSMFSLLLVLLNIVLILITGYGVNRLKNLAPNSFLDPTIRRFYKEDVPEVRRKIEPSQMDPGELATTAYKEYLQLHHVDPEAQESIDLDDSFQLASDYCAVMQGVGKDVHLNSISAQAGQSENDFMRSFLSHSQKIAAQATKARQSDSALYHHEKRLPANRRRSDSHVGMVTARPENWSTRGGFKLVRSQTFRGNLPKQNYLDKTGMIKRWMQLERWGEDDAEVPEWLPMVPLSARTSVSEYLTVISEEGSEFAEPPPMQRTSTPINEDELPEMEIPEPKPEEEKPDEKNVP